MDGRRPKKEPTKDRRQSEDIERSIRPLATDFMIGKLIEILSAFIVATISTLGYAGIVLLMAIESACIPLPSEIIMPFSGYLVYTGRFNIWLVSIAGAFGCVVGSLVAYWIGMYGGRPLIEKYGKYLLISSHDLNLADRWFDR